GAQGLGGRGWRRRRDRRSGLLARRPPAGRPFERVGGRGPVRTSGGGVMTDFVSFRIGDQLCGIEAALVQQVVRPRGLTRVPLAPPEIAGIMSLRGRIVTAVCARTRLGLPPRPNPFAIGLEHGGDGYGLLVDVVGEVLSLDPAAFEPAPGILPAIWSECVS